MRIIPAITVMTAPAMNPMMSIIQHKRQGQVSHQRLCDVPPDSDEPLLLPELLPEDEEPEDVDELVDDEVLCTVVCVAVTEPELLPDEESSSVSGYV